MKQESGLDALVNKGYEALLRGDWIVSDRAHLEIIKELRQSKLVNREDLRQIAKRYLSSIFGTGLFLFERNESEIEVFQKKVENFREIIYSNSTWRSSLDDLDRELHEVQILLTNSRADARNKAANALRRIGRPDLTVKLCDQLLVQSRLNYYFLTTRSWALSDLGEIEKALLDAELALKHQPKGNNYPQIALSRAYRLKFKRDGDLSDSKSAISWARQAITAKRNFHAANQLAAALLTAGVSKEDPELLLLEKDFPRILRYADVVAIESAATVMITIAVDPAEDFEDLDEDTDTDDEQTEDRPEDYYEDYFPEHWESLDNPRSPHLEP